MISITQSVRRRGGLTATYELYAEGHTQRGLAAAVHSGSLVRVRQGWYALSDTSPALVQAVRVGGRLTGLSALELQGFWSYPTDELHVAVHPHDARLRTRLDKSRRLANEPNPRTCVHWRAGGGGSRFMLDPIASLEDVMACQDPHVVVALADSVLFKRPQLTSDWLALASAAPRSHRTYLGAVDGLCESGTESIFFFRIRHLGLTIARQVKVAGVGRVDFRIGPKLVIEVDGAAYHTDPAAFHRDRHRDAVLSRLGYRVLRFSYYQVLFAWEEVEAALIGALLRGDHQ
ncbi:endonuclease domain-containing protein [Conyzicola sp.]|uniref:endonuclease domain-containing protein n=1 Tax=Conyzicola sp. TaxID=1969404 RepID=UPI003989DBF5